MGLFDQFKARFNGRTAPPRSSGAGTDPAGVVAQARVRARRRLIGAAVLLVVGIIGFPLLFETQPRPIPVDIPIEIPSRDAAVPLMPASQRSVRPEPALQAPPVEAPAAANPASEVEAIEAVPASAPAAAPKSPAKAEVKTEPKAVAKPAVKAEETKTAEPKPVDAKAADPKPTDSKPVAAKPAKPADPAADEGRFVVQVGAFAEADSAREARTKVEALGLRTYTQVIESASGRRIRVRVGPYPNRAEADKAAARIKSGGLQAAVLVL